MALVLTRRTGETIHIGDDVTITVTEVTDSNKVRLAIDAPREIAVHRKEIYQRIQREKAAQCTGNGNRCDKCKGHPEFCPEAKPCAA